MTNGVTGGWIERIYSEGNGMSLSCALKASLYENAIFAFRGVSFRFNTISHPPLIVVSAIHEVQWKALREAFVLYFCLCCRGSGRRRTGANLL